MNASTAVRFGKNQDREDYVDVAEISRAVDERLERQGVSLTPNEIRLQRALDNHLLKYSKTYDGIARSQLQKASRLTYDRDFNRAKNGLIEKQAFWYEAGVGGLSKPGVWGYVLDEEVDELDFLVGDIGQMLEDGTGATDPNPSDKPLGQTPRTNPSVIPEDTEYRVPSTESTNDSVKESPEGGSLKVAASSKSSDPSRDASRPAQDVSSQTAVVLPFHPARLEELLRYRDEKNMDERTLAEADAYIDEEIAKIKTDEDWAIASALLTRKESA